MEQRISRRAFAGAAIATATGFAILRHARGEAPIELRCSLDTAPSHPRKSLPRLPRQGRGGVRRADQDQAVRKRRAVPRPACGQGAGAGPGGDGLPRHLDVTGFVPDADFSQLPAFYGRPIDAGAQGDRRQGRQVRQRARSPRSCMSRCSAAGSIWASTTGNPTKKPLNTLADLKGMKIRSPGGVLNSWRIRFLGGIPNVTAWPDVPLAMSQGTFDGLITTNNSAFSSKLYDSGLRHSLQDHQGMGLYVPLVNQDFWSKLDPKLQETMRSCGPRTWPPIATTPPTRRPRPRRPAASRASASSTCRRPSSTRRARRCCRSRTSASPTRISRRSWSSWSWRMSASDPRARQAGCRGVLARIDRLWTGIERLWSGVLGGAALLIAVVQVFGRYIDPANAITWAEEVIVYIAVWAVMIIASQLVRADGHVRPGPRAPPAAPRRAALGGDVQLPGGDRLHRRHGVVRLAGGEHRADARSAQLDRSAVSDVDLLSRAAGRRRADADALRHPAAPLCVLLRSATMSVGHDPARGAARAAGTHRALTEQITDQSTKPGMATIGFLLLFFGLLAAGMPIFLVLGACASVLYFVSGQPIIGVAQNMIDQLNSTTLMALPLFVMAAAFMRRGGVAQALVDLSTAWLGGMQGLARTGRGGVVRDVRGDFRVFGGDRAGDGHHPAAGDDRARLSAGVLARRARRVGHDRRGIPPSLALILYGIVTEQSVPRLFLAGIMPGLLQAAAFFLWVLWYARRKNFPSEPSLPLAAGCASRRARCRQWRCRSSC